MQRKREKKEDGQNTRQGQTDPTQVVLSEIETLIRARYPIIYIVSQEEKRVIDRLKQCADRLGRITFTWSALRGLELHADLLQKQSAGATCLAPEDAITHIRQSDDQPSLFLLLDFHPYLQDPRLIRSLRETAQVVRHSRNTIVLISPRLELPVEIEKDVVVIDFPLPGPTELLNVLSSLCRNVSRKHPERIQISTPQAETLVQAAQGLTAVEAEHAFSRAIVTDGRLTADDQAVVLNEKQQIIRKSGILRFCPPGPSLDDIGGLAALKTWLLKRARGFSTAARDFGLPPPRGILLLGAPGVGKSLVAKAASAAWNLPLLSLDMGRIFSSFIGASEQNMRDAIRLAECTAPAVLWIDEIEKGFAGSNAQSVDGGAASRIFGTFLTWMQEKQAPLFVIATANQINALPPELLRRGRFDENFFADLPAPDVRLEILGIHLRKRSRNPDLIDLSEVVSLTHGFSGAEIEHVVIEALYAAFAESREIHREDLVRAARLLVPLSVTFDKQLNDLRGWARGRAMKAD